MRWTRPEKDIIAQYLESDWSEDTLIELIRRVNPQRTAEAVMRKARRFRKGKIDPEIVQTWRSVDRLINRLESLSPVVPQIKRLKMPKRSGRAFEVCIMDPHYGMTCFTPESDAEWSPALCESMVMSNVGRLLELGRAYTPFDHIFMPIGNDFFHTDNIWQTTTAGTPQPEAEAFLHTFIGGETLAIAMIEELKRVANVFVYPIPGNHDRATSFMLGRVLQAYYHNDANVQIVADASPYKFHQYGVNLIGYEHGHSIPPIRLAALMANECPEGWLTSRDGYREWHIGDQHRKGSAKPSAMEEQGVSVEFLPGLTPPNEWHRLKSFNYQKRGSVAFVWDELAGPIARLQVNVNRSDNKLMGTK